MLRFPRQTRPGTPCTRALDVTLVEEPDGRDRAQPERRRAAPRHRPADLRHVAGPGQAHRDHLCAQERRRASSAIEELDETLSAEVRGRLREAAHEGSRRGPKPRTFTDGWSTAASTSGSTWAKSSPSRCVPRSSQSQRRRRAAMAARKPRRHAGEHDLIEAFGQPGCPVCRLSTEAVDAYLTSVCYEQVNDLDLREQLRSAGGFCRPHAERFIKQRLGQLAAAIVYRDVLNTARKRLRERLDRARPLEAGRRCSGGGGPSVPDAPHLPRLRGRSRGRRALPRRRCASACRRRPSARSTCGRRPLPAAHRPGAPGATTPAPEALAEAAVEMLGVDRRRTGRVHPKHDYRFHYARLGRRRGHPRAGRRARGRPPAAAPVRLLIPTSSRITPVRENRLRSKWTPPRPRKGEGVGG